LGAMDRIVPSSPSSHLFKAALFPPSLTIPIHQGSLVLGTWQGIYLCSWSEKKNPHMVHATIFEAGKASGSQILSAPVRGCHHVPGTNLAAKFSEIRDCEHGLCQFFICHTSAAICVNSVISEDTGTKMVRGRMSREGLEGEK
jgi:thiamine phosphate synthase YjbQ (UPF0047 family)